MATAPISTFPAELVRPRASLAPLGAPDRRLVVQAALAAAGVAIALAGGAAAELVFLLAAVHAAYVFGTHRAGVQVGFLAAVSTGAAVVAPGAVSAERLLVDAATLAAAAAVVAFLRSKLAATTERLDTVEALPLAIVELDEHGAVQSWSGAAEELLGWSSREVLGRRLPITAVGEDAWHLFHQVMGAVPLVGVEVVCSRRDTAPIPVSLYTGLRGEPAGSAGRVLLVVDARERKELEERLARAGKLEALGQFASGIVHDFSNLILVIRGHAEIIRGNVGPAVETELAAIERASEDASRILRQLVAFGRKSRPKPELVGVNDVLDAVGTMVEPLLGHGIELVRTYDTRPATVLADRTQLELVVLNLVLNARDAEPDGGTITLRSAVVERGGERRVEISVADTGHGMDDETRARIFEPFFTTKDGRGTGLGLSIVHDLTAQNGGTIDVSSAPGHGTTFRIALPFSQPAVALAPEEPSEDHGLERVLLVENDRQVFESVGALERFGYRVETAKTSADAARRARDGEVDVLVADLASLTDVDALADLASVVPVVYIAEGDGPAPGPPELRLTRPFSPTVLASTIRAALRSVDAAPSALETPLLLRTP